MQNDSKLTGKIKAQITRFTSRLTAGWKRPTAHLVAQMLYGIQAAKDVKVSNIARSLNESIALIKTENRLCRNLANEDLTDRINRFLCWEGAGAVHDDTVLALDLGDIHKPYAKKMEYLARVRDGSTGQIVNGYWLCQLVAADPYGDRIVPMYAELYSQNAEDFDSENEQMLKAIRMVSAATGGKGIVTIDRGGDRRKLLKPLIDKDLRFVVRQKGDRHLLLPSGALKSVEQVARGCKSTTERVVEVEREGYREQKRLRLGTRAVRLPERPDHPLWLVVIRGLAPKPIVLLTNVEPADRDDHAGWIADVYLTRWKCEETYRFVKQSYNLEDVRVRSYTALRNLWVLVHAVFYFVSVVIGTRSKLRLIFKKVCAKAQRFYEIAAFFHYSVADGIYAVLFSSRGGLRSSPARPPSPQRQFAFAQPPP